MRRLAAAALLAALASATGFARVASADDGRLELNQAQAASLGFPLVLTQPGSYVLTSDLDVRGQPSPADTTAIEIQADFVTLDLNGFSIIGPNVCSGGAPAGGGLGLGIYTNAHHVTVKNGTIRGAGGTGLYLGDDGRVEDVAVTCSGGAGISAGARSLLRNNTARVNAGYGLELGTAAVLSGNALDGNAGGGPQIGGGPVVVETGANACNGSTSCVVCGNGTVELSEVCDGSDLAGESCSSQGFYVGTLTCDPDCLTFDTSGCTNCGNNSIQPPEVCDGSDLGGETCVSQGFVSGLLACSPGCDAFDTSSCNASANCGNAVIEVPEVCDGANLGGQSCPSQGFYAGTLACAPNCLSFDTSGCTNCGNFTIEPPEVCDGNNFGGQTCADYGFALGSLVCTGDCSTIVTSNCTNCGNNSVEPPEVCDGTDLQGQTCTTISPDYTGGTLSCSPSCNVFNESGCICDPFGPFNANPPNSYSCIIGSFNVNQWTINSTGGTGISVTAAGLPTLSGSISAPTCPGTSFSAQVVVSGNCTETYTLTGSFTSANIWSGSFNVSYSGGPIFCGDCTDQNFTAGGLR